jgi:hypothetical protein
MASPRSEAVTAAYRQSLIRASARLATILGSAWVRLTAADRNAADEWVRLVVPIVLGAQIHAVTLSDAYLSAYLSDVLDRPIAPLGLNPAPLIGVAARRGAPLEQVYSRPLGQVAKAVGLGVTLNDALRAEQWRVASAASTDVQLSARAARVQWAEESPHHIRWQRVTGGSTCALCASAAGKTYASGDLMPLHAGCNCTTEPVVDGDEPRSRPDPEIDDSPELAQAAADGESVARVVHDPELGPLLEAK